MASKLKNPESDIDAAAPVPDVEKSIFLSYTNENEVSKLIRNLDNKKSCGYDCITNKVLKSSCNVILPHVVNLFNICIRNGIFSDIFKMALVVPLFKGGDKQDLSCYQPISWPALGKLFEKI